MFNFLNRIFKKKNKTNELGIKIGDRFYSEYFKSNGTVQLFTSDDNWSFTLDGNPFTVFGADTHPKNLKWIYRQGEEENNEAN